MTRVLLSRLGIAAAAFALLVLASGCGADDSAQPAGTASPSVVTGDITVLAAASLTESFTTIGQDFESRHPETKVTFSFGSSATLATQITNGAPADVFASANETTMGAVQQAGLAIDPKTFTTNTLEIAVPKGNPGKITGLADFAKADKLIALCAKQVPCGSAAQKVFKAARITPKPDSYEADVKATLTKVELGEVDAALVYRTDVQAAGDKVQGIDFPEAKNAVNTYPISVVKGAPNPATAAAFVAYVHSDAGQRVLARDGFGTS